MSRESRFYKANARKGHTWAEEITVKVVLRRESPEFVRPLERGHSYESFRLAGRRSGARDETGARAHRGISS